MTRQPPTTKINIEVKEVSKAGKIPNIWLVTSNSC